MSTPLRPELGPLPERIARLPIDPRGYPVPWFVAFVKGVPEFRAADREKWARAIQNRRCWVCGDPLGAYLTFVLGPMCGINRTTAEPACHLECAEWSARFCPFLSRPHAVRREDGILNNDTLQAETAGTALARNPGVTLLWTTKQFSLFRDGKGGQLIHVGEPLAVRWFAEGRVATRVEILTSIERGLPALMEIALAQDLAEGVDAVPALQRAVAGFIQAHVPADSGSTASAAATGCPFVA